MRRITRRSVYAVADSLLRERKAITQHEVHEKIEEKLGRKLTKYEKARVTLLLRNRYTVIRISRRKENGSRVVYFR